MDLYGMKRKDLQTLCKKHGIPANLKNVEMAARLASLFEKETEETGTETKISVDDSVETDGIEDNLVVSKEAKKVTFSPENEVFEYTRSVKIRKRKNVRPRIQVQDLQQGGIELRRSKRNVAKGILVAGSSENESNTRRGIVETEKECSWPDVKVPRRSKRIGSSGIAQDDCKVTELIDLEQFEDKDISKGELQMEIDNQDSFKLEKLRRRSTRLTANLLKSCVGETLLPAKRSKLHVDADDKDDELAEDNVKEVAMTFQVQVAGKYHRKDAQDDHKVEKDPRRKSHGSAKLSKGKRKTKQSNGSAAVNGQEGELVKYNKMEPMRPLVVENVEAVKRDDLELEKAPTPSKQLERKATQLLVDGQAQKGDKQPKRTYGNDRENTRLLRSSKRTAVDNLLDQATSNSPKRCSIIHCEQDGASVDTVKKLNVDDEMQFHARLTMNYSRHDSSKTPEVVDGSVVEKQIDETLDSLVKSSKKAERRRKRDRSAEPGVDIETASTQSNLRPNQVLYAQAQSLQEKASGFNLKARGSSKKSKTKNQDCVRDKLQGTVVDLPSSSETKVAEFVMIAENVLDCTPGMSVDSSQTANTEELNSEVVVGKCEDILELDTLLMVGVEEDTEEVRLEVSNPEAEQIAPTGHIVVKDIASTVFTEEDINTKEHNSVAKLADVEVTEILENSSKCWEKIHSNKDDEIRSLEKELPAADLHGNFSEYNNENNGAEEEMETIKTGCMSVAHCVNLTPEKLLDEYAELKAKDAGGSEESSSIFETKVTEPGLIYDNYLDSTVKDSGDISPRRNTQGLNSELMEGEREEKHEQDTISMAAIKNDKEEASPPPEFLVERSEVSNSDSEQGGPTDQIVVKKIAPTVIAEEDIETIFISKSELKENSSVAKLTEVEEIQERSAECWKEIHSSKNVEVSLEKEIQAANLHGNFSDYNTESNSAKEQSEIRKVSCTSVGQCVHLQTLDEVKDGSLETPNQTISSERGCKLNALELSVWSSSDFAREVNVSECFGKDEKKALYQPLLVNKTTSSALDESTIFTTPERNLMLMELVNGNGAMRATDSVTHHNDEAIKSQYVISRSPEQFLNEAGKEEERTAADFLDESDLLNNTDRCLVLGGSSQHVSRNEGDSIVIELHDVSNISTSPVRQFSMADFKVDETGRNEENGSVDLHCKSGTSTSPARRAHLGNSVSDGAENSGGTSLDESAVFTTPERNLLMELVNENGPTRATDSVSHHNDETVDSHYAVSTTPEQFLDEAGKEEEHKAADFLDECDLLNNTSRCLVLGGSSQHVSRNEGDSTVVERHDVSDISASPVRQFSMGDFKGDEIRTKEENGGAELHCKSGSFTSPARRAHLGKSVSDGAENSGGNKAMERHEVFESSGQLKSGNSEQKEAVETGENLIAESHDEFALPNIPEDSELDEAAKIEENKAVELLAESDVFTIAENQLLLETDEGMKGDNVTAKSQDVSDVFTAAESHSLIGDSEPDVAAKSEENKAVELLVESDVFSIADNLLLLETDEGMKGDNVTANSQDVSDVFTAAESHFLIRDSEPDVSEKGFRENKDVELLGESNNSTNSKSHSLSGDSGLDETRRMKENALATLEESFPFTFSETRQLSGNSEQHNAGNLEPKEVEFKDEPAFFSRLYIDKSGLSQYQSHHTSSPKVMSKDDSVVLGSHVASLDFSENTIVDSNGRIACKLSSRNEFHAEQETAGTEFIIKGLLAESSVRLEAIQETSKQSKGHSPQLDSVNLFDLDIENPETILKAERDFPFSSNVLVLPAEGNSETIGEISGYPEVAGTCSMVSEESGPSTDVQNQINDAMVELAITDNDEAKELVEARELTEAKETKNSEKSYEANLLLNSSGSSYVSGKKNAPAEKENEQLAFNSEVNLKNTCEKNGEDEATGPIATVFVLTEKAIDVTPDESIVQNNRNEKAADMEMITRETTPNPEGTLKDSSEKKEYMNIDESDTMFETQVRKEPILVCRTQVKPGRHDDMKENALNSKIVQKLNVTAPRTSKRQPLKDLKN